MASALNWSHQPGHSKTIEMRWHLKFDAQLSLKKPSIWRLKQGHFFKELCHTKGIIMSAIKFAVKVLETLPSSCSAKIPTKKEDAWYNWWQNHCILIFGAYFSCLLFFALDKFETWTQDENADTVLRSAPQTRNKKRCSAWSLREKRDIYHVGKGLSWFSPSTKWVSSSLAGTRKGHSADQIPAPECCQLLLYQQAIRLRCGSPFSQLTDSCRKFPKKTSTGIVIFLTKPLYPAITQK